MFGHIRFVSVVISLGVLPACESYVRDNQADAPKNAIAVGHGIFMIPVGKDESGCPQYTAWSARQSVPAVIQYRQADGQFSPVRERADCPPT